MTQHDLTTAYLNELANVGAGSAATALAAFAHTEFSISQPIVQELRIGEAVEMLGWGDEVVTVALLTIGGDLDGLFALFVPDPGPLLEAFGAGPDLEAALVGELGNLAASKAVAAVEAMTGLHGSPRPPAVATTSARTILQTVLALSAQKEPFTALRAELTGESATATIVFFPSADVALRLRGTGS